MREGLAEHGGPEQRIGWLICATFAIALLHFGRPVLEPIAIAGILTLTLAPLVRRMRTFGLPHAAAALVSVGLVAACAVALGVILATQFADVVGELPQYRAAVASKLDQLAMHIQRPLQRWQAGMVSVWPQTAEQLAFSGAYVPVAPNLDIGATLPRLIAAAWTILAEAAVVLVLLLFMLLSRDSIRERVIRLTGEKEVAHTMQAVSDTDEGVSRFFASLVVVNAAFAATSSIALALLGVPHAILWGTLAGTMRFVPYLGLPAAVAVVAAFCAGVQPGWTLMIWSVVSLVSLDLILANAIEPHVYGHTMGLAPFGIIVAAVFWGSLWGPVGLILSAPLTLCLVVAGRHVPGLAPIAIMLGESPRSTRALLLYQRALAGETQDVLDDARRYARRHGLARYCDDVLLPALALGRADSRAGRIDRRRDRSVRTMLVALVESLRASGMARRRPSLVEANVGLQLRRMREAGRETSKGALDARDRSILMCVGLRNERDELLTELLVRAVRAAGCDARSMIFDRASPPSRCDHAEAVSLVLVTYPDEQTLGEWRQACEALRALIPGVVVAAVKPPEGIDAAMPQEREVRQDVQSVLHSFSEAVALATTANDRGESRTPAMIPERSSLTE